MKKTLALLLATVMLFCLAACATENGDKTSSNPQTTSDGAASTAGTSSTDDTASNASQAEVNVDMTKYPSDINEWTAKNFVDYFNEAVNFPKDCETWVQDHATYWAGQPIYEASGIWNTEGACDVAIMIFVCKPDSPDTTPEKVEELKQAVRDAEDHMYVTEELMLGLIDHMVGNVMFTYSQTPNEEVLAEIDAAYNNLVKALGVTPDF